MTPLGKFLYDNIKFRGPMSIATWMRHALMHPELGYYTQKPVFGGKGDFTTSVELSNMFCAVMGVWVGNAWRELGRPGQLSYLELGPGRGTLAKAVMDACWRDKETRGVKWKVELVESSRSMRQEQERALREAQERKQCSLQWHEWGYEMAGGEKQQQQQKEEEEEWRRAKEAEGPLVAVAHEYFDALPVYRFRHVKDVGWREELVGIAQPPEEESPQTERGQFVLTLAGGPTPPLAYLGPSPPAPPAVPAAVEVSAAAQLAMRRLARSLRLRSGCALLVDYGVAAGPPPPSLRGIRNHRFEDWLDAPGEKDISADVDFGMLRSVARQHGLAASECVTQKEMLHRLGLDVVLTQVLRGAGDDVHAQRAIEEYSRLMDDMGSVYKALCLASSPVLLQKIF